MFGLLNLHDFFSSVEHKEDILI